MSERYYKVLRSNSLSNLEKLLLDSKNQGWEPVGGLDEFDGKYAQTIQFKNYDDDVTEIITVWNSSVDD